MSRLPTRAELRAFLANFPLPEPIIAALAFGVGLRTLVPLGALPHHPVVPWVGAALTGTGAGLLVWSTVETMETRIAEPDHLVTTGPYRWTRNPMYVGWLAVAAQTHAFVRANAPNL